MQMQARFWRLWLSLLLLPLGLMVGGCGGGKGKVSGKVTYNGKVVPAGTVQIVPVNGPAVAGEIAEDGSYNIENVTVGPASVVVETDSAKPPTATQKENQKAADALQEKMKNVPGMDKVPRREPKDPRRYVPIPPKYSDRSKPELQLKVKSGKNPYDIDLK